MKTFSLLGCQNSKRFLTKANALVLSGGNLVALTSLLRTHSLPFAKKCGCIRDVTRRYSLSLKLKH